MHLPNRIRLDEKDEATSRIFAAANHDLRQPIPANGDKSGDSSGADSLRDGASIRGMRIALVEDDRMVRNAMVDWLSMEGADVAPFASAETALADPRLASVDAVISDLQLREAMNGLEFIQKAKAIMPPSAGAILMTGNHMSPSLDEARSQSILVLLKPVPPDAFLRALCAGRTREPLRPADG